MGVVAAQVLATCTNQSRRQALETNYYVFRRAHKAIIRTWSFVLKQRGLGHEGGERVRGNAFFLNPLLVLHGARHMCEDELGPLRSGGSGVLFCAELLGEEQEAILHHDPPLIAALYSAVSDSAVTGGFKSCKQIDIDLKKGREFHILIWSSCTGGTAQVKALASD